MPEQDGPGRLERRVQGTVARRRAQVEEYVRPHLQPDEQIVAVLVRAYPSLGNGSIAHLSRSSSMPCAVSDPRRTTPRAFGRSAP